VKCNVLYGTIKPPISMERNPPSEAGSPSAIQEILQLLWKLKSPLLGSILRHLNSLHFF